MSLRQGHITDNVKQIQSNQLKEEMNSNDVKPHEEYRPAPSKPKRNIPKHKPLKELFAPENSAEPGPSFNANELKIGISGGDWKSKSEKELYEKFDDFRFLPQILKNIRDKQFGRLTKIQQLVIPVIMGEKDFDLLAITQMGCGKIVAYLLPIIDSISKHKEKTPSPTTSVAPYAIILAPTKEIVIYVKGEAMALATGTSVSVVAAHKDFYALSNIKEMERGCDILCITPGRLFDYLEREVIKLDQVQYFVVDEADLILRDKFYGKIKDEFSARKAHHHTYMFSPAFNDDVGQKAIELLKPGYFNIEFEVKNSATSTCNQKFLQVDRNDKLNLLYELLVNNAEEYRASNGKMRKTIIFVENRRLSDTIAIMLSMVNIIALSVNCERSQNLYEAALDLFEKRDVRVLVVTNLSARGLRVHGVRHVINFDMPKDRESYINRICYTGRDGYMGNVVSFFDMERDYNLAAELIKILQDVRQEIPDFLSEIGKNCLNVRKL